MNVTVMKLPKGSRLDSMSSDVSRPPNLKGPWKDEPDRMLWRHRGFPCLIRRGQLGALCGYVGVEKGHPWHGVDFTGIEEEGPDVHGGVTYCKPCDDYPEGGICHVPEPGEEDEVWWVGFDCAHMGDLAPGILEHCPSLEGFDDQYRDIQYVVNEVERLRQQAEEAARE